MPFYLWDCVVQKFMYKLKGKPYGKRLSGKAKIRDESNIKMDLRQYVTAYMNWLKDILSGRVWYSIGEPSCSVIMKLIVCQGFSEVF
jgi:hypothetical protein